MIILGIETSCDETAISLVKASANKVEVLSNIVSSQIELHAAWGGVVPNLAAREHLKNIIPVFKRSLKEACITKKDIDLISVTKGPGLIPALLVGTNFAKTLSYLWEKPLLGIHHIEGHIYANFIGDKVLEKSTKLNPKSTFPLLALVVSGGHTQLIYMKDNLKYEIIGETQDDAVGEAFDKVARILGLGYPGGPAISAKAEIAADRHRKNADRRKNVLHESASSPYKSVLQLPRPMIKSKNLNFSFSGLKTAALYATKDYRKANNLSEEDSLPQNFIEELAYEFQEAATDVLVKKTIDAAKKKTPKTIIMAGGVSANKKLDEKMKRNIEESLPSDTVYKKPNTSYSLDNASMIASAAYYRWRSMSKKEQEFSLDNWKIFQTNASLKLE
jgi:N6-L-threonylcarbamoyladenine synthase